MFKKTFNAILMTIYSQKFIAAIIGGLFTCYSLYALLSVAAYYLYFANALPLIDFMDPESNAVEISKNTKYMVSVSLVWLVSISLSGVTAAKISRNNHFMAVLVTGVIIFTIYYALLPDRHIIEIYPTWYIYSPFIMAISAIFVGPAILRSGK